GLREGDFQSCPLAWPRLDRNLAAYGSHPLLNDKGAATGPFQRRRVQSPCEFESSAVVLNDQGPQSPLRAEPNPNILGPAMLQNVRQCLLHDSGHFAASVGGQADMGNVAYEFRGNAGIVAIPFDHVAQETNDVSGIHV